jgi:hypothetical protein
VPNKEQASNTSEEQKQLAWEAFDQSPEGEKLVDFAQQFHQRQGDKGQIDIDDDVYIGEVNDFLSGLFGFRPDKLERKRKQFRLYANGKEYTSNGRKMTGAFSGKGKWDMSGDDWIALAKNYSDAKIEAQHLEEQNKPVETTTIGAENEPNHTPVTGIIKNPVPPEAGRPEEPTVETGVQQNAGGTGQGDANPPPPVEGERQRLISIHYPATEIDYAGTGRLEGEFGLNERKPTEVKHDLETQRQANEMLANGYDYRTLVSEALSGKRQNISDAEVVILNKYADKLANDLRGMDKNAPEFDQTLNELQQVKDAANVAGKEAGRTLRMFGASRATPDADYAGFFMRTKEANGGAPLTEEQKTVTEQQFQADAAVKAEVERTDAALAAAMAKEQAEQRIAELEAEVARLNAKKGKSGNTPKKNAPKKTHADYAKERQELVQKMKEDLLKIAKGAEGFKSDIPLLSQLKAADKYVTQIVKSLVEEGVTKLADVTKEIYEQLKDAIPDLTEKHVHDLIAGEYREKKQTRNELSEKIKDLRDQAAYMNKLDALLSGEVPKTEKAKRQRIQEIYDLQQKIKDHKQEVADAAKFYGESDSGERRIQAMEDELGRLKERREKEPKEENKRELSRREQQLRDDIEAEKKAWAAEKAHDKRMADLQEQLDAARKRTVKTKEAKAAAPKTVHPEEQKLLDAIDAEKEKWAAEKDAARQAAKDYQKMETERNRQLAKVQELKEKIDGLQQNGLPATKKGGAPKEDTPEIEALKKQKADLEKSIRKSVAVEKKMQAMETELQRLKDRKAKAPKAAVAKAITARAQKLRDAIEAERKAWKDELRKAPEETALKSAKTRLDNEIKKIEEQIRTGNFDPAPKKTPLLEDKTAATKFPALYKEAVEAKDKLIKLRQERDLYIYRTEYERRSVGEKILDGAGEILNIPRSLMSSLDFSAPLRQGLWASVANPSIAAKAFVEMFRMIKKTNFDRWFEDIKERPEYAVAQASGLYLADPHNAKITAREEQFMSQLAEKIPIVGRGFNIKGVNIGEVKVAGKKIGNLDLIGGSERAYTGYLNRLRWDLFNSYVDKLQADGKTMENSPEVYKAMAHYVNDATGRGNITLKKFEQAAPLLNSVFFSPRLIASRVNLLTKFANPMYWKAPKEMRVMYAKDFLKVVATGLATMAIAKYAFGADVEDDPRSSDFGKIIAGNTRLDVWGGFLQYIRYTTQIISGEVKNKNGVIQELGKNAAFGRTRWGVAGQMLRGKSAPIPGAVIDVLAGTDVVGNPVTIGTAIQRNLQPLIFSDFSDAYQDDGLKGIAKVLPSVFGVGVSTHLPKVSSGGGSSSTSRSTSRSTNRTSSRTTHR